MGESRYGSYFVTGPAGEAGRPSFSAQEVPGWADAAETRVEPILRVDDEIIPGSFYSQYVWLFPVRQGLGRQMLPAGPTPHVHPFDEVISFVGTNEEDLTDLGGEIELWLEDRRFLLTKSFLVYVPAGMRHCPLSIRRIERPIFQYILGSGLHYEAAEPQGYAGGGHPEPGKCFVFHYKKNLVHPEYRGNSRDEPGRHEHIIYLDAEVVPKANFYVEASWFGTAPRPKPVPGREPTGPQPHSHPFPELITFFGTNYEDVHDLGGEAELWIDGEQHILGRSFAAYIPGGVVHCPLMLRNITRPIFHFTAGPGQMYV